MHKKRLKNWARVGLISSGIILTTVFSLLMFILLCRSYNPKTHDRKLLVSYNSEDSLTYKVNAKQNSYYTNNDLSMGKQYISSILDKIDFKVGYDFESSKLLNYTYNYSIIATLVSNYDGGNKDKELWSKEFIIEPQTTIQNKDTNSIGINKGFSIDYQTYNNIMQSFKDEFKLNVDAYLNIDFKVDIKSNTSTNNQIEESNLINVKIPLLKDTTYITYSKTGVVNKNIWATVNDVEQTNIFLKVLYGLGLLFGCLLDRLLLLKIYKVTEKDRYFYEINRIFKSYPEILVKVLEVPEHLKLKDIKVSNFNDMIDVSEELHLPILYFEDKSQTEFIIINDIYFYNFTLKKESFIEKD
jgi:hypothetical protein